MFATGQGVCRTVKRFRVAWLEELAKAVEAEFQRSFEAHRAHVAVSPVRVSGLTTVAEGLL
jgi:hypothetical protein